MLIGSAQNIADTDMHGLPVDTQSPEEPPRPTDRQVCIAHLINWALQELEQQDRHKDRLLVNKPKGLKQARRRSGEGEQAHLRQDDHLCKNEVLGRMPQLPVPCKQRFSACLVDDCVVLHRKTYSWDAFTDKLHAYEPLPHHKTGMHHSITRQRVYCKTSARTATSAVCGARPAK